MWRPEQDVGSLLSSQLPALVALKQGLLLNLIFNLGWLASELQASLLPSVGITSGSNHAWFFKRVLEI